MLLAAACAVFLTVGRFGNQVETSRHVKISADIQQLNIELEDYRHSHGSYPKSIRSLRDPWGTDYIYVCPGKKNYGTYDLFSAGPDHRPDTADDDWGGN
jgi:Type II secretion system (T2SS), protein G